MAALSLRADDYNETSGHEFFKLGEATQPRRQRVAVLGINVYMYIA